MTKTYITENGDTFSKIALKFYGDKNKSDLIADANSFKSTEQLFSGTVLTIPEIAEIANIELDSRKNIKVDNDEEISFVVNNTTIKNTENNYIKKTIGTASDFFMFSSVWDDKDSLKKKLFAPFQYQETLVYIGNDLVITGKLEKPKFTLDSDKNRVVVYTGRTKTGVLADTKIDKYPLEFNNQNLEQIVKSIITPYGLVASFTESSGAVFSKVSADIGESPFNFINNLARKRGFLISSTEKGELLFWKSDVNSKPVISLIEGQYPFISGNALYDGAERFSSFRLFGQSPGVNNIHSIVKDSALNGVMRPFVFISKDMTQGDNQERALWERSRSIGNSINIELIVSNWRKPDGTLWKKNEMISCIAPSLALYKEANYIIKSVEPFIDIDLGKICKLNIIFPEVYTLDLPKEYPWEI